MSNWQTVFTTSVPHQAEIVKAVLSDRQINVVVVNKKDSSYHFGAVEVQVVSDDVIKSLKIIEEEIKFD